jgi:nucleotide-binding universal stress UspA family protein
MMCPEPKDKLPKQLGKNIAIAWDGSVAASRAVVQAMPLLSAADDVTIITNTSEPIKVSPEELQDYLSDHGVEAKIVLTNDKGDVGASILSKAAESGAEILVLGAYSSNKNLERVVGGVTQHVVDHASMPVIFVN